MIELDLKFVNRIKVLVEQTKSEDCSLNSGSHEAFWEFARTSQNLVYDKLFLLENGNLHATWKDEQRNHIGLEFVDKQTIGFVIFKWRESYESFSRLSGFDTIDGIRELIIAYELNNLLFGFNDSLTQNGERRVVGTVD